MVAVPQYNENKVAVDRTPTEYRRINTNADAFGESIALANQRLGEASLSFFNAMADIKKSIDQTKAIELSNYIDQLEKEELNDPNNGYYSKLGKDAMADPNDPSKGANAVLDSISQKISKRQEELGLTWGYGYKMAEYVKTRKMDMLYRGATSHELKETKSWAAATRQETVDLAISKGILHRDNEEDIQTALGNGKAALLTNAKLSHWDADTTRIALAEYESQFHAGIIQAYAKDGSLKASEYYEKNKDKLLPKQQDECLGLVKNTELRYISESVSDRLFNLYPEDEESAYAEVDKIENVVERDAIESRLTAKYNRKRSVENHQQDQLMDEAWDNIEKKIENGEVPSEDDIPLGLNGKNKMAMRNSIDSLVTKGDVDTDNSTYLDLYDISVTDAQGFAKMNLAQYRPYLSKADYKAFQKRQIDIKNMTPTQLTDDDVIIKNGLKSLGYSYDKKGNLKTGQFLNVDSWGHTKANAEAYTNTFNAYIREIQLKKGKNLSREELNQAEREFTEAYKENPKIYQKGMNDKELAKNVGFMRSVISDFATAEKNKGSALTVEEKNKIVADRVSRTVQEENTDMANTVKQITRSPKVGDIWQGHRITSVYGKREAPTTGASTDHKGVDLAYLPNEKIQAFASGTVVNVGKKHKALGNYIDIKSADGTIHRYAHCNSILANKGDEIITGQNIARAGSTGISTGTHLHYEQIVGGKSVNPIHPKPQRSDMSRIAIYTDKNGKKAKVEVKNGKIVRIIEEM